MTILLDNGHGQDTPGKRSPDGFFREYAYTRFLAKQIQEHLIALGLDARLLVPELDDISLPERCRRVNTLERPRMELLHHQGTNPSRQPRNGPLRGRRRLASGSPAP